MPLVALDCGILKRNTKFSVNIVTSTIIFEAKYL